MIMNQSDHSRAAVPSRRSAAAHRSLNGQVRKQGPTGDKVNKCAPPSHIINKLPVILLSGEQLPKCLGCAHV
ncbi:unnamed protein product [Parnassius apollo]|uniref:(apollo) hypothetical protein n=1 Tax=Parnassius apollo TaxID=110799 RepID=A0A8S3WA75_PARAO|nr:unnamed protein product [Parnassius apollo]